MTPLVLWFLLSVIACALAADLPRIQVALAVQFGPEQNVSALDVTLQIDDTQSRAGRPLLQLDLNHGLTPTLRYDGDALSASDSRGTLALSYTDTNASDAQRTWVPLRDPEGQVSVGLRAVPRATNASTPSGPRIDLRADQGGAIGMATGFIPHPPADEDCPVGRRGPLAATLLGASGTVLSKSYFAVGPLKRWPSWDVAPGADERPFYVYWIGDLPYDSDRMSGIAKDIHLAISSFFGDATSPFRVFWRRVPVGYGGAGGHNSFILEWADGTAEEQSEEAVTFLLSHETIHEYALMAPTR
ncbi:hypothetical protein C8A00DRAFT_33415 [Chaetomidium leptoderma]|uniref:Uncharacterized protein n=1 Tax=Chaetomidium leptoderma TaxID=669021 RepID=A0AAN6ZWT7_9PEZI|nr:hypothetical protein C8A00DRAFT_33415 [Chaetomidium leptoderma]